MTLDELNIANAWLDAADDLGISVISPFVLKDENGEEYSFIALIKDVGSPQGTLICLPEQWDDFGYSALAEEQSYYCSGLYAQSYSKYDREHFIETLNDWGWFGEKVRI
jgi:hypothetical protein